MKSFIEFKDINGVQYHVDPLYICAMSRAPTADGRNYVFVSAISGGIMVDAREHQRVLSTLDGLDRRGPDAPTQ